MLSESGNPPTCHVWIMLWVIRFAFPHEALSPQFTSCSKNSCAYGTALIQLYTHFVLSTKHREVFWKRGLTLSILKLQTGRVKIILRVIGLLFNRELLNCTLLRALKVPVLTLQHLFCHPLAHGAWWLDATSGWNGLCAYSTPSFRLLNEAPRSFPKGRVNALNLSKAVH